MQLGAGATWLAAARRKVADGRRRRLGIAALAVALGLASAAAGQETSAPAEIATEAATPAQAAPAAPAALAPTPGAEAAAPAPAAETALPPEAAMPVAEAPVPATEPGAALGGAGTAEPGTALPGGAAAGTAALPRDLSPWGMYQQADVVVKSVMIGLVLASIVTWTVWIAKSLEIVAARARLRRALGTVLAAPDLATAEAALGRLSGPAAAMVRAAGREAAASAEAVARGGGGPGLLGRVGSELGRIEAHAGRRLAFGTGVLATIGAIAPFVGLFGTVWGIMNAFIGISEAQTTNLAVVAPGIAEALLATALGLVAAIPAVVIYNLFARAIAAYRGLLADAAAGVERLVSRDLDHRRLAAPLARAAE